MKPAVDQFLIGFGIGMLTVILMAAFGALFGVI